MTAVLIIHAPILVPVPQGSKTQVPSGPKCRVCDVAPMRLVEVSDMGTKGDPKGHRLAKFRAHLVELATMEIALVNWQRLENGADLKMELIYQRHESHLKINGALRKGKPVHKVGPPDLSKLLRAVEDAMTTAEVWRDDAQVVNVTMLKRYAKPGEVHGVAIEIREAAMGLAGLL